MMLETMYSELLLVNLLPIDHRHILTLCLNMMKVLLHSVYIYCEFIFVYCKGPSLTAAELVQDINKSVEVSVRLQRISTFCDSILFLSDDI